MTYGEIIKGYEGKTIFIRIESTDLIIENNMQVTESNFEDDNISLFDANGGCLEIGVVNINSNFNKDSRNVYFRTPTGSHVSFHEKL